MKLLTKSLLDDTDFNLDLKLLAGAAGLSRIITHPRVQKPGLALAGFLESIRPHRIQVLGKTELAYLNKLEPDTQREAINGLMQAELGCVIITSGLEVPKDLIEAAESLKVPLMHTQLVSSILINRVNGYLDEHLSPQTNLHGVLMDVYGVGILIIGPSGIGKSECALDLVVRGHRMVADDMVIVKQQSHFLVGSGSTLTRHHMEVRGLGIINVKDLFGAASVRENKRVELVVEMTEWQQGTEYDRTGIEGKIEIILETPVPKIVLPIRPGRNVASIVEVAARNQLLKIQGHHSAREFQASLERRLAGTVPPSSSGNDS